MTGEKKSRIRRLYRALLRAFPFDFRWDYGPEMEDVFLEQRRDAETQGGKVALVRLWWETFVGIMRTAPGEHWEMLRQDGGYALKTMSKRPGFAAVAVVTLALGIGANVAIFSLVNGILLEPLPFQEADRIVQIFEQNPTEGVERASVALPNFLDWRSQNSVFEDMAVYDRTGVTLAGVEPRRLSAIVASSSFLRTLGVVPIEGRDFPHDQDLRDADRVVLIGEQYWVADMGRDPSIVGRTMMLDGEAHTVIGVFSMALNVLLGDVDVIVGMAIDSTGADRSQHAYSAIGKLRSGVVSDEVRAELETISLRLEQAYPETNRGWQVYTVPIAERIFNPVLRATLLLLTLGSGFVLLIGCANVANLLLARATSREQEVAVRMALGAGRVRIVRQFLTESVLLAVFSGLAGILLAAWSLPGLIALVPAEVPRIANVVLDGWALLYAIGVSVLTGVLFGLVPAVHSSRPQINEALKEGGRTSAGRSRARLPKSLVVSEVALAFVLLVAGGLSIRSFQLLTEVDLGFRPDNLLTVDVALPESDYDDPWDREVFYRSVVDRLNSLAGVRSAAAVTTLPMGESSSWSEIRIEPGEPVDGGRPTFAGYLIVSPNYFQTMGLGFRRGRSFGSPTGEGPVEVVVNDALVRAFFPGEVDPIGKQFQAIHAAPDRTLQVVGVVGDVPYSRIENGSRAEVYLPIEASPRLGMTLIASTEADPTGMVAAVRNEIWSLDPNLPTYGIRTMDQVVESRFASSRAGALMMGMLGCIALLLAVMGIHGVLAYSVSERTHEIGVRMTLGASRQEILRLVLRQGLVLSSFGLALGLVGALALGQLMSSLVFGISPFDPTIIVGIMVLFLGVALLASYLPARNALKVDPVVALRQE